jgi:IS605 OrfB family transposase
LVGCGPTLDPQKSLFQSIDIRFTVKQIETGYSGSGRGRPRYPVRAMLLALMLMHLFQIPAIVMLATQLSRHQEYAELCGFNGTTPEHSTFSKFITRAGPRTVEGVFRGIRRDALHKATTMLAKTKSAIGVEDLAVSNMMANHRLASGVADASLGEFMRMLEYKAQWYGCTLARVGRFYPSTKRCSRCGAVKAHMSLSERVFRCDACGLVMDRDLNSALNLEQVAASWAETLNACKRREVHAIEQVPARGAGTETGQLGTPS